MYSEMSLSGSSDSRCRSWATIRFAIWSSTGVPRKMIRSLSRRLYMSKARSPREVCSPTIGTSGLIVLASFTSSAGILPTVAIAPACLGRVVTGLVGGALAARGPELAGPGLRVLGIVLSGGPELLTGLGLLDADRRGLGHEQLERL